MPFIDLQDGINLQDAGPSAGELAHIHAVVDAEKTLNRTIALAAHTGWDKNNADHVLRSIIDAWECLQTANEVRRATMRTHAGKALPVVVK